MGAPLQVRARARARRARGRLARDLDGALARSPRPRARLALPPRAAAARRPRDAEAFARDSDESPTPIPRHVPIKVDPKVFFSNERTYLSWLHMSVTLASISVAIVSLAETKQQQLYGLVRRATSETARAGVPRRLPLPPPPPPSNIPHPA